MKSRIYSWVLVVSLLSTLLTVSELQVASAASSTTTTATISKEDPNFGEDVIFTVTVTPTSYIAGQPITGNIIIAEDKGELCASSTLTENPTTHAVTASCTWTAAFEYSNVKAVYKGDANYTTSSSSFFTSISVIGVTDLNVPRVDEGSSMTISAWANYNGTMAFKSNGSVISGCNHESKTVTSGAQINCT
jgi:hypothetical protein